MRNCFGDPDAMLKYPGGSGGEISEVIQDGVFDSSRGEGLLAFKERNALVDGNAGPGGERFGSVLRCSPSDNSSSNLDVGSGHKTQSVSVDNSKEVTAEDSVFSYLAAVGSFNKATELVEDAEELDKICEKYVLAEEETEHFVLGEEPFVRTPDTITLEDAETGDREFLEATCSRHGDDCTSSSNGERKDCAERCGRFLQTIENSRHLVLEDRLLIKGPEMVDDGQHNTVPGISQMRDVSENPSVACVVLEVGHATEPSYEDKGFNNRRSLPLISPGLANDCSLIRNTGQTPKQVDAFPSLLEKSKDSVCSARTCVSEPVEVENIILSDEKSSESSLCKYKVLLSDNENTEKHQPFNSLYDEEIISNYLRCQREVAYDHPEENSVSSRQTVVSVGCQISDIPEGIRRGLLEEVTSCFFREGPSFQQPCSSYCKGRVADDANTASTSTKCSDVKNSYGQVSDGGMVNSKSLPLIVFRRTNPKRAASLRKDQFDAKPDHLTNKRIGVRKCKRTSGTRTLFSSINVVRRKRSCFHRMERQSLWGKISSLMTFFKENDKHGVSSFDQPQSQSKNLKQNQCCRASGKIQMAHSDRSLRSFKGQCAFPTLSMHTKCQTWEQLNIPNEVDSQCSIETSNNAVPDFSSPTELFIPIGHSHQEPVTEIPAIGESFLQRDGIQGDKDVESSLTQDISCENVLGDCPGFSSHIGSEALAKKVSDRRLLDPESSPDSDIYNPVAAVCVTADAGTLIVQDARVNLSEAGPQVTLHGMDDQALKSSEPIASSEFPSSLDVQQQTANKKGQKERKDGKICRSDCNLSEHTVSQEKFHNLQIHNTALEPLKYVRQRRNGLKEKNLSSTVSNKKAIRKGSRRAFPSESTISGKADPDHSEEAREEELGLQTVTSTKQGIGNIQIEENRSLMSDNAKLDYLSRSGRTKVRSNKSSLTDSPRRHRVKSCGQKNFNMRNLVKSRNKKKNQKLVASQESYESLKLFPESARDLALNENELRCNEPEAKGSACGLNGQSVPQRQAWVLCDDCHKWRCISTALADMIDETHCGWTCKDNTDKAFADCSIPQEKTNSEINAELEISDASCDDDVPKQNPRGIVKEKLAAAQPAAWTHIKSNLYLHRNRKSQTIDETMVCYCKPPSDGSLGCGDQCLNRMLNIECVKGTCPCGDLCANQQFQKRKYARLKWIPCGKKGFGLQLLEGVPSGQFLIEYVGEVLDFSTYEARQKYYASRGQKHFYFMTLNGGEVIDACAKGNLGRFINHSCDPNCRTEKWMVNGEVCIGLFAIRDIKKGEELTFDYNYVRVFGAAAKKCVCGSSVCRGYIGGDPLKTELVVQADSEDEYFEAVMDDKCKKKALIDMDVLLSDANGIVVKDTELPSGNKVLLKDRSPISETEDQQQFKDTLCPSKSDAISFDSVCNLHVKDAIFSSVYETQSSENCSDTFAKGPNGNIISPSLTDVQQLDLPIQASPAATDSKSDSSVKVSASGTVTENKLNRPKSSHSTHHTKKSKPSVKAILPQKAKTLQSNSLSQYEGVEKELNELLDANGGISRRKDATRGYLKLLFVTAAEGDSVGGASQSIRDLSLILDALLKTVSRTVLMDIIDKNGLQMLHNIMKQNRSRFSRIPIIRKLLKVLEFLALKGILTPEHINKGPPCSGMESFKESMLSLTRHNDVQVQQIARSFRDRWIPRMIKRVEPPDREEQQFDPQRSHNNWSHSLKCRFNQGVRDSDAIVCVSEPMEQITSSGSLGKLVETSSHSSQVVCPSSHYSQVVCPSLPLTNDNSTLTRTRKRKSRWDQPSDCKVLDQQSLWSNQEQASETGSVKIAFSDLQLGSKPEVMNQNIERHTPEKFCNGVMGVKNFKQQNAEDEVPPGFGSLQEDHHVTFETEVPRGEVVVGFLQERYLSHLSVSYGIPVSIVQKLGCPDSVTVCEGHKCWTVAPSIPFHPFPPLPPYPRGQPNPSTLTTESHKSSTQGSSEEAQPSTLSNLDSRLTDAPAPSVSLQRPADNPGAWSRNMNNTGRMSWTSTSGCCEKRFFRPERGNNQKFRRRWEPYSQEDSGYGSRSSLRSRDAGRSSRDDRQYWPPWSREDSNVLSKVQKDKDSIVGVGNVRDTGCGSYYQA